LGIITKIGNKLTKFLNAKMNGWETWVMVKKVSGKERNFKPGTLLEFGGNGS